MCWERVAAEHVARAIRELFARFDADGDGELSQAEYKTYLRAVRSWGWESCRAGRGVYTDDTYCAIWPVECAVYRSNAQLAEATAAVLAMNLSSANERIAAMQVALETDLMQGWSVRGFDPSALPVAEPVQWLWERFSSGEWLDRSQYCKLLAAAGEVDILRKLDEEEWEYCCEESGGDVGRGFSRAAFEQHCGDDDTLDAASATETIQGAALYTKGEMAQLTRPLGATGVAGVDSISLAGFEATKTRDLGERTAGATRLNLNGLATELYLARSSGLGQKPA
eukprot:COSAG04_NODE_5217_length_1699_cov_172.595106_2_plen_282_part_00